MNKSIFADRAAQIYKHRFSTQLVLDSVVGGKPPGSITTAHVESKFLDTTNRIFSDLEKRAAATGAAPETLIQETPEVKANCFLRDAVGRPCLEGKQVKALIKEAANILWPTKKWGPSNKGTRSYIPEHIFVEPHMIPILDSNGNPAVPTIEEHPVHSKQRRTGIAITEVVRPAVVEFLVLSDVDFGIDFWADVWVCAEKQGLGAERSMGHGTFSVTRFDAI